MTITLHPQNFVLRSSGGLLDSRALDPPTFTVAPTSVDLPSSGGTIQFSAANAASYSLTISRTGITINSSTGLVTVAATAAGTAGSITVRATNSAGQYTDALCTVTVAAVYVPGTGRILHTNFAGLSFAWDQYDTYNPSTWPPPNTGTPIATTDYAAEDIGHLVGTDPSTGQVFSKFSPVLWGGYRAAGGWPSLARQAIAAVRNRWTAESRFLTPSQLFSYDFLTGIGDHPLGITTAIRNRYNYKYRQPDQSPLTFYPDVSRAQGLVYQRFWIKLPTGFWNAISAGGFRVLTAWKGVNNQVRGSLDFVKDDGVAQQRIKASIDLINDDVAGPWTYSSVINKSSWSPGYNTHQFYAFDVVNYGQGQPGFAYSAPLAENVWHKVECASHINSGVNGFLWAALNGTVFCNYQGQIFFDGAATTKIDRLFILSIYANLYADNDPGLIHTGYEVWEQWPSDATAPHP